MSRYLCTRWLPTRQDRLRPTTAFRYEQMIDRYVLPHIGRVPLRSLTITHLQDLYAQLRRNGRHDGGPLSPKTVLNVHQILRTALGDADRAGLVPRNVARLMNPPCHGVAPEQRCWNEHQLQQFLHVAMTHRLGPAIWLAAMTGMRRGEVLGLRWSDIDLDAATLSIRRSVSCTGYRVHTTPTKTRTSRRAIDLDQRTVAVLRDSETTLAAIAHGPLGRQQRKRKARYQWSQTLREHRKHAPKKSPNLVESTPQRP